MPAGRRSKWGVLIFWVIVAALTAGPAGLLMGAQKNDAVSWLPGGAESTKVIDAAQVFQAKDEIPAIVVYESASATPNLRPLDGATCFDAVARCFSPTGVTVNKQSPSTPRCPAGGSRPSPLQLLNALLTLI